MNIDYPKLIQKIKGSTVSKPLSGTLSGHAAGEPFDKHVYQEIKKKFPENTFRQYEYLNDLYSKNAEIIGYKARQALFDSPTVLFLLSRGKNATDKWSVENPFDEKQNDTADILVVKDNFYEILDIKTRNISKSAQPPNIISAYKLAQLCAKMIDNKEFDNFTLNYFEIDWELDNQQLICKDAHFACLFLSNPENLYINWAAAMQIQFQVCDLDQEFTGSREQWAKLYLSHFVKQAKKRANDMIEKFVKPFEKYIEKHIYFLGIGGIGMSNLARYYHLAGVKVSGYDKTPSAVTQALENEGISIYFDENLQQFEGITDLVYTPAIKEHLAFEVAKEKGIVPMKRSQILGEICKNYQTLGVAGTHGKTTTSTMLAHLTRFCGVDTTAFLGGISKNLQGNFAYGKSEYCVVEADEFDRSFLTLFPKYAIITSLDADHLDIYGKHEEMLDTYRMFGKQVSDKLLVNTEIENFDWQREVISYGIESGKYQAQNLRFANLATTFDYVSEEITIKDIVLPMPGKHNVANATAAITLTLWAGGDMAKVKDALANFKGIERRFEVVMHTDNISLINDYAHHPTELAAAIGTAKSLFPDRQVIAVFQPHLFTRTRDFYEGFAEALSMADAAILIPIYPAREKPLEGITSQIILDKISIEKKVLIEKDKLNDTIQAFMEKPTIVLILGAGDIDREIGKLKFNH